MELWDAYYPDGTLSGETLVRGEPIPPEYRHAVAEVLVIHRALDAMSMSAVYGGSPVIQA